LENPWYARPNLRVLSERHARPFIVPRLPKESGLRRSCFGATQALTSGQKIFYAKTKSHKIAKLDGTFRIPTSAAAAQAEAEAGGASTFVAVPGAESPASGSADKGASAGSEKGAGAGGAGSKREREESGMLSHPVGVKMWADDVADDEMEMEMEEDDD
jgi:hypothetical protein